jgi:hypothetical protein
MFASPVLNGLLYWFKGRKRKGGAKVQWPLKGKPVEINKKSPFSLKGEPPKDGPPLR